MAQKAIVEGLSNVQAGSEYINVDYALYDTTTHLGIYRSYVLVDFGNITPFTNEKFLELCKTGIIADATLNGYTITLADVLWTAPNPISSDLFDILKGMQAWSFNNAPSRSIVTAINSANGFQISATRNATASYSVTIQASASGLLAGASSGYVVFEICPTNSATGSNWIEVGRWTNGQTFSSILTLSSTQPVGGDVMKVVPAGYYVRLRSVNVSGTPTYTVNSGQEVLL